MLGECLSISRLPGNALRTLVDIARLVNFISKDANLVFCLLVYPLFHSSNQRL